MQEDVRGLIEMIRDCGFKEISYWYQTVNYFFKSAESFVSYILNIPQTLSLLGNLTTNASFMSRLADECEREYDQLTQGEQRGFEVMIIIATKNK